MLFANIHRSASQIILLNRGVQYNVVGVLLKKLLVDWHQVAKDSSKAASSELQELLESKEWIKQAAKYGDISDERKLFLYAGHDSTITNLLRALNVWQQQIPDYGITIMLELLQNRKTNEYGVQVSKTIFHLIYFDRLIFVRL